MIKVGQFNLLSKIEIDKYEKVLNSPLCNIKRKDVFKDLKGGYVIVYLEWDDERNLQDD